MKKFDELAPKEIIDKTVEALKANGINAQYAANGQEAKEQALTLIPQGAEVMTMTSVTLDTLGLNKEIDESGKYASVKATLSKMDRAKEGKAMNQLGTAPEYTIGSVHAITQDGKVVVASNTGSQLPAYAYGAQHVIWIVGAQKITKDLDDAMKRIYEHVLPLESERARKAYGTEGSNVSKLLIFNKEVNPNRLRMIIVNESLGY